MTAQVLSAAGLPEGTPSGAESWDAARVRAARLGGRALRVTLTPSGALPPGAAARFTLAGQLGAAQAASGQADVMISGAGLQAAGVCADQDCQARPWRAAHASGGTGETAAPEVRPGQGVWTLSCGGVLNPNGAGPGWSHTLRVPLPQSVRVRAAGTWPPVMAGVNVSADQLSWTPAAAGLRLGGAPAIWIGFTPQPVVDSQALQATRGASQPLLPGPACVVLTGQVVGADQAGQASTEEASTGDVQFLPGTW